MASYGHAMQPPGPRPGQPPVAYGGPIQMMPATAPHGTFAPGTRIQVGGHRVVIQKYLSEGGFAHVYLVKMPTPVDGTDLAVLKRVAVPDKDALRGMRTEVETMKRLKGHKPIVTYIDSHASELRGGGYEVFLLMEYCNGGGLIDFMNTRLQHRLTEPEILNIFSDVAEGVACMHYLKPPLLHRDLKVENVLITTNGSRKKFKLCDFGSASAPKPAPVSVVECRLLDEDLQKHTTLQYRSPEMIDVYRKQPIDEKSDIWALGVLLYKLCYYTTPFEDQGQLAILNASYRFPSYPAFSDKLKKLIASMLKEHQESRPNIYQVLRESCAMQGREVPIKDIYSVRSRSEPRGAERAPITEKPTSTPVVGAVFAPPPKQQQVIPEVVPMRRGRPPAAAQPAQPAQPAKPNPSPMRVTNGDPFAALDTRQAKLGNPDELSSRFPTLDQFSLLHDQGTKFSFDDPASASEARNAKDLNQKVADKLADDAFSPSSGSQRPAADALNKPYPAAKPEKQITPPPAKSASAPPKSSEMSRASAIISSTPELQAISSQASQAYQSPPSKPVMVSTGTMTSTPPPERPQMQYQIYHFPSAEQHRSSSLPRQPENVGANQQRSDSASSRPGAIPRIPSFQSQPGHARHPSSSRPSLEGARPSPDLLEPTAKPASQPGRPRPVSTHLESNMDYLREKESAAARSLVSPGNPSPKYADAGRSPRLEPDEETNIESNVEFLRSMEDPDSRKEKTHPKQGKRSSLSGTKHMLAGRFGDAFKRFESNTAPPPARTPSPLKQLERQHLEPIAGSEATDGRSDGSEVLEETDDMTPEARREIERRRLSMEEKRVAAAGAEYRQRIAQRDAAGGGGGGGGGGSGSSNNIGGGGAAPAPLPKSIGGVSRAVSIQNRVQSLLQDSQSSSSNVARTAEGYGRYADTATAASRVPDAKPEITRKPVGAGGKMMMPAAAAPAATIRPVTSSGAADLAVRRSSTVSSDPTSSRSGPFPPQGGGPGGPRPLAKPKPTHLNKNLTAGSLGAGKPGSPTKPPPSNLHKPLPKPPPQQHMVATDLPGQPALDMSPQEKDDYLRDFAKRYPSLTSIEMVERDLAAEGQKGR